MLDATLAIVHHLCAFGVVAAQAIEVTMLRGTLDAARLRRLLRVDALYGLSAGLLLGVGLARVAWGPKGVAFYTGNPTFWIKLALFGAVAALSVAPTLRFARWAAAAREDPAWRPDEDEVARTRRQVIGGAHLLVGVMVAAALMARGIGT
jgi:putative membrane protein